jgi:hypothetical protein
MVLAPITDFDAIGVAAGSQRATIIEAKAQGATVGSRVAGPIEQTPLRVKVLGGGGIDDADGHDFTAGHLETVQVGFTWVRNSTGYRTITGDRPLEILYKNL